MYNCCFILIDLNSDIAATLPDGAAAAGNEALPGYSRDASSGIALNGDRFMAYGGIRGADAHPQSEDGVVRLLPGNSTHDLIISST